MLYSQLSARTTHHEHFIVESEIGEKSLSSKHREAVIFTVILEKGRGVIYHDCSGSIYGPCVCPPNVVELMYLFKDR